MYTPYIQIIYALNTLLSSSHFFNQFSTTNYCLLLAKLQWSNTINSWTTFSIISHFDLIAVALPITLSNQTKLINNRCNKNSNNHFNSWLAIWLWVMIRQIYNLFLNAQNYSEKFFTFLSSEKWPFLVKL